MHQVPFNHLADLLWSVKLQRNEFYFFKKDNSMQKYFLFTFLLWNDKNERDIVVLKGLWV